MKVNSRIRAGFTLVELLVVIAIIAILTGVVLVAINPAEMLRESRDATRLSDLDSIRKAIDLSLANGTVTLTATAAGGVGSRDAGVTRATDGTGWVNVNLGTYLATLPQDPDPATTLEYVYGSDGNTYELNCAFESAKFQTKYGTDGGEDATLYEVGTNLAIL